MYLFWNVIYVNRPSGWGWESKIWGWAAFNINWIIEFETSLSFLNPRNNIHDYCITFVLEFGSLVAPWTPTLKSGTQNRAVLGIWWINANTTGKYGDSRKNEIVFQNIFCVSIYSVVKYRFCKNLNKIGPISFTLAFEPIQHHWSGVFSYSSRSGVLDIFIWSPA